MAHLPAFGGNGSPPGENRAGVLHACRCMEWRFGNIHDAVGEQLADELGSKAYINWGYVRLAASH